jgi:uncharacterized protein (TIGR03435 family)
MMQSLLEDRFKVKMSKQDLEAPVLALVLAKPGTIGPHLLPHSPDPPCPKAAPPGEAQETIPGGFPLACHGIILLPSSVSGVYHLGARDITLGLLADTFTGSVLANFDRPLIDATWLTGTFDFTMECTEEPSAAQSPDAASRPDSPGPTFQEALLDQLGIKLVSQKGTIEVFILDHVEHPTEN